jgi:hypothetical protein
MRTLGRFNLAGAPAQLHSFNGQLILSIQLQPGLDLQMKFREEDLSEDPNADWLSLFSERAQAISELNDLRPTAESAIALRRGIGQLLCGSD